MASVSGPSLGETELNGPSAFVLLAFVRPPPLSTPCLLEEQKGPVRTGQIFGIMAEHRDFGARLSEVA